MSIKSLHPARHRKLPRLVGETQLDEEVVRGRMAEDTAIFQGKSPILPGEITIFSG